MRWSVPLFIQMVFGLLGALARTSEDPDKARKILSLKGADKVAF